MIFLQNWLFKLNEAFLWSFALLIFSSYLIFWILCHSNEFLRNTDIKIFYFSLRYFTIKNACLEILRNSNLLVFVLKLHARKFFKFPLHLVFKTNLKLYKLFLCLTCIIMFHLTIFPTSLKHWNNEISYNESYEHTCDVIIVSNFLTFPAYLNQKRTKAFLLWICIF